MAWQDYSAFASYDNHHWFRVPTRLDGKKLVIEHQSKQLKTYYAYFVPYTLADIERCHSGLKAHSFLTERNISHSVSGVPINCYQVGQYQANAKNVWIIARQHPGETMAQWIAEGIIYRLCELYESEQLVTNVNFFVVMNMNPDGSAMGNHRTNAQGKNLNRCWSDASELSCPKVLGVQRAMAKTGVDFFIDLHGDESIPFNFMMVAGSCTGKHAFKTLLEQNEPRFQTRFDYNTYQSSCESTCSKSNCGAAQTATRYVAKTFGAPSFLIDTSYKQLQNRPQTEKWDNISCIEFGHNIATTLNAYFESVLGHQS